MMDLSVAVVSGLLGIIFMLWYQYRKNVMNTFKRLNVPGPEPHLIFGNIREFIRKGPTQAHKDWTEKYGKIFGYFLGSSPILVVGDPELLRNIQVKDFQNFINRPMLIPGGLNVGKLFSVHLIRQRDQKWRNMRAILTPSFTSGKMKQMVPIVKEAIEEFLSNVDERGRGDGDFDIYAMFKALTLDVIGRAAFGIKTKVQENPKTDDFLLSVQDAIKEDSLSGAAAWSICLPELTSVILPFRLLQQFLKNLTGKSKLGELAENCRAILKTRRENPQNTRQDLMQLMLDAQLSQEEVQKTSADDLTAGYESDLKKSVLPSNETSTEKSARGQKKIYHMNDDEILSNTFLVLFAGFDTTSTALGFTTHVLVNRQDIQQKIRSEVEEVFKKDGFLDFTNVSRCKYLDQVLYESLRYYPPVAGFVSRECASNITYGSLLVPKGMTIQIPIALHRDPDYWTNPDTFDPDRFAPENKKNIHPMAFQAFGAGPRNCIGMRFAQMEAKLALANLLLRYRLIPGNRTEKMDEIEVMYKAILMNPKNGVFVKIEKIKQ